jgi:uncharacterized protein (TIGR02266 family)
MDSIPVPGQVPQVIQFESVKDSPPIAQQPRRYEDMRQTPRLPVALEVSLESDSNFYVGLTENLSEGGVFVATVLTKAVGSMVALTIDLDDDFPAIKVEGEVRWLRECEPRGMGIRFTNLTVVEKLRIRTFGQRRDPMFFAE